MLRRLVLIRIRYRVSILWLRLRLLRRRKVSRVLVVKVAKLSPWLVVLLIRVFARCILLTLLNLVRRRRRRLIIVVDLANDR